MPLRDNNDGTFTSMRVVNRPPRSGDNGASLNTATVIRGQGHRAANGAPIAGGGSGGPLPMPSAAAAALAVGAATGARAARYAVEAVQARGLGESLFDMAGDMAWKADHQAANGVWVNAAGYAFDGSMPGGTSSGGGGGTSVAQDAAAWAGILGPLANTGMNIYGQVSGQPRVQQQAPSTPMSTGAIVGILGVVLVGITVAIVATRGGKSTSSNPRRRAARRARTVRVGGKRYYVAKAG